MINKQKIIIVALAALLILSLTYITADKYAVAKQSRELALYQTGAQTGYATAINQIMQQVSTCQLVPLYSNNVTINIIAVDCLNASK